MHTIIFQALEFTVLIPGMLLASPCELIFKAKT